MVVCLLYGAPSGILNPELANGEFIKLRRDRAKGEFRVQLEPVFSSLKIRYKAKQTTDWWSVLLYGAPSGIRTRDPLIKSQLLYQLS